MKKFLSVLLAVLLLTALSVPAFADSAPSPENPEEIIIVNEEPELDGILILTLDKDKDELPADKREIYDEAVEMVSDLETVIEETEGLADVIDGREVGVSSTFNIRVKEGYEDRVGFPLKLKLKIPGPEAFVALLLYSEDHFDLIETELEDDIITFTVPHLGPFAIISLAEGVIDVDMTEVELVD